MDPNSDLAALTAVGGQNHEGQAVAILPAPAPLVKDPPRFT